jgi:hypothetical protein
MSDVVEGAQNEQIQWEPQGSLFSVSETFVEKFGEFLPPVGSFLLGEGQPGAALILGYATKEMDDAVDLSYRLEQTEEGGPNHHWQVLHRAGPKRQLVKAKDIFAFETGQSIRIVDRSVEVGKSEYLGSAEDADFVVTLLGTPKFRQTIRAVKELRKTQANASFTRVTLLDVPTAFDFAASQ